MSAAGDSFWNGSSAGRAPGSQPGCHGFEPHPFHARKELFRRFLRSSFDYRNDTSDQMVVLVHQEGDIGDLVYQLVVVSGDQEKPFRTL